MLEISLCMIVRDEEETLGRCLESVKEAVDEIVIVDTGSRDGTKEIARAYTKRCTIFPGGMISRPPGISRFPGRKGLVHVAGRGRRAESGHDGGISAHEAGASAKPPMWSCFLIRWDLMGKDARPWSMTGSGSCGTLRISGSGEECMRRSSQRER